MQSYAAVGAVPTSSACRQPVNAPGHSCEANCGLTRTCVSMRLNILDLTEPIKSTPQRDFYLDTFFNPMWMLGPNVFSFAKDGTVMRPELGRVAACSKYQSRVVPCSGRGCDKPWKNVAITEQDDSEFAAMQEAEGTHKWAEVKSKLVGRVYKWPPMSQPTPCEGCAVLEEAQPAVGSSSGVGGMGKGMDRSKGAEESVVPALSWSSGESETESEVSEVVPCQSASGRTPLWSVMACEDPPLSLTGMDVI